MTCSALRSSRRAAVVLVIALSFIIAFPADASRRRAVAPPPPSVIDHAYLNAARAAASWLESLERRGAGDALSWPTSEAATGAATGVDLGAAGIGAFHLRLYEVTGEHRYLDKAIGAGSWIANAYASGGGGVDWLGGRAGGGEYFLALYEATGDGRWRDEAKKAAASLIAVSRGCRNRLLAQWTVLHRSCSRRGGHRPLFRASARRDERPSVSRCCHARVPLDHAAHDPGRWRHHVEASHD